MSKTQLLGEHVLRIFSPLQRADHIIWMRRQTAETIRARVVRLLLTLVAVCCVHAIAIAYIESIALADAFWLTLTTVTTVGYGDISAATPLGRITTVVFLYMLGISLLAQVAGEFVEYRIERRNRMITGQWRWRGMKDHLLIINVPIEDTSRYLSRFIAQIRSTPEIKDMPVQLLTPLFDGGLPNTLREIGAVHRCAQPDSIAELELCNVQSARFILLLASDSNNQASDAMTLNLLILLKELGVKIPILAEAVEDANRERFIRYGATSVLRPVRAYPEIMVRAMVAPGAEVIMEDLFSYGGVYPKRINVRIEGRWGEIANKVIQHDFGVPIGYVSCSNRVESSPATDHDVDAIALILIVSPEHEVTDADVQQLFKGQFTPEAHSSTRY